MTYALETTQRKVDPGETEPQKQQSDWVGARGTNVTNAIGAAHEKVDPGKTSGGKTINGVSALGFL